MRVDVSAMRAAANSPEVHAAALLIAKQLFDGADCATFHNEEDYREHATKSIARHAARLMRHYLEALE